MFGKKKQALPPYPLQVLTTESLIDGIVEDHSNLQIIGEDTAIPPLPLTSVTIQTTGPMDIPTYTCDRYLVMRVNTVALIPRVDIAKLEEYEIWTLYKKPFPGELHVGPYMIQGKMLLFAENRFERQVPIIDVRIVSRIPGAHLGELFAPFALVTFHWLYGYEPQ